jgi:hypothetical protein
LGGFAASAVIFFLWHRDDQVFELAERDFVYLSDELHKLDFEP